MGGRTEYDAIGPVVHAAARLRDALADERVRVRTFIGWIGQPPVQGSEVGAAPGERLQQRSWLAPRHIRSSRS
jgi:hypothetical protein